MTELVDSHGATIGITDLDFASVLRYFGFRLVGARDSDQRKGRGKPLTEFVFEIRHPSSGGRIDEILRAFTNDELTCSPRKLLSEARHLKNVAHQRNLI